MNEVWRTKISRSLRKEDGMRRVRDLRPILRAAADLPGRYRIYPAEDPRVITSLQKVIRGLNAYHGDKSYPGNERVWGDIWRGDMPEEFFDLAAYHHADPEVADYFFVTFRDHIPVRSLWVVRFFGRTLTVGAIFSTSEHRRGINRLDDVWRLMGFDPDDVRHAGNGTSERLG
ncbi:hypothetical protein GN330_12050 [Nitratireductor sp. CAU 1489]|uniref:Uncharacterized protein n=1 Tax=Nitratireductor arenosus TaxID=2682096 RepID=A0A844QFW0_9HYPH|nr:hypothetical protein [Nitratireductor arenosus]MVA97977.1 hypothetical protein [Nitratireductor arenosus]